MARRWLRFEFLCFRRNGPALTAEKKGNSGQREFLASSQDWELVAPPLFVVCLIFMNSGCIIGENLPVLWASSVDRSQTCATNQ